MKNSVKRVTKKALSFLLAVAMMFSVLSVAITALANEVEIVYTVTEAKPALPAQQGKVIDLKRIQVEIGDDMHRGDLLEWSTNDTTGGIIVGNGLIAMLGSDIYAVEAVVPKTGEKQTVYIMQPDENGNKVIYDHKFSSADITYANSSYGEFTAASEWKLYDMGRGAGYTDVAGISGNSQGIVVTNVANSGFVNAALYLDPDSASGKRVSAFSDYTIETKVEGNNGAIEADVGPYIHLTLGEGDALYTGAQYVLASAYQRSATSTSSTLFRYITSESSYLYAVNATGIPRPTVGSTYTTKYTIVGNTVAFECDLDNDGVYGGENDASHGAYTIDFLNTAKKGTIGLHSVFNNRPIYSSVTVTITLDTSKMSEYLKDEEIYVVSASKPALPMYEGQKLDLSKLFFEFDNGVVAGGSQIAWDCKAEGIEVNNSDKTITVLKNGMYEVAAAYAKAGDQPKTFYVITPDGNNNITLYEKTFDSKDVADGDFTAESEWLSTKSDSIYISYINSGVTFTATAGATSWSGDTSLYGTFYLNPETEKGKLVKAFSDLTVETKAYINQQWGGTWGGTIGPVVRFDLDAKTKIGAYYRIPCADYTATALSLSIGSNSVAATTQAFNLKTGVNTFVLNVNGTEITTTANGTAGTFNMSDSVASSIPSIKNGTIGFNINSNTRTSLQYIKVTLSFSDEEIKEISDRCSEILLIKTSDDSLTIGKGKKLDLNDIYFQFKDGTCKSGSDINISTEDKTGGIVVDNENKSVALLGSDIYKITLSADADTSRTIAVLTLNANNERVLLDYTFSAADNNLAAKDSSGNAIWLSTGDPDTAWGWNAAVGYANVNARLQDNTNKGTSVLYLNPESEAGKIVSSFADYTFYLTAVTHQSWIAQGKSFIMLTRYNMAGDTYSLANDTYLGYRAYFGSNGGAVYAGNANAATSSATWGYNSSYPNIDFKLKVAGGDIEFSAKSTVDTAYNLLYKTSDSNPAPAAALATKGKAGTIAVYSDQNNRPGLQKASVYLSYDKDYVDAFAQYTSDVLLIEAGSPIIPVTRTYKVDLSDIYFEFNNGYVALGKDITWSTNDTTGGVLVADADKSVALLGSDMYEVIAKYKGETKSFFVVQPKADYTVEIYSHEFRDKDISADKNFTEESEWVLLQGNGNLQSGYHDSLPGLNTGGTAHSEYVLNPTSENGKIVSNFRDVIIDLKAGFPTLFGSGNSAYNFILSARANWADNSAISGSPASYAGGGFTGANGTNTEVAFVKVSGKESSYKYPTYTTQVGVSYNFRVTVIGDEVTISKNGAKAPVTSTYAQNESITDTKAGTIHLYTYNTRIVLDTIKVSAVVNEEVAKALVAKQTSLTVVSAGSPALPLSEGKNLDVSNIFFEFDSGNVISGASIVWESNDTAASADNDADTILLKKNGIHEVIATYQGEADKTIYLVQPDGNNNITLYEKAFDSKDVTDGDFTAESEWLSTKSDSIYISYINSGVTFTATAGATSWSGDTSLYGTFYLNPETEKGKLVKAFSDLTVETKAYINQQWGGTWGGTIGPVVRFDLDAKTKIGAYYRIPCADYTATALSLSIGSNSVAATTQAFNLKTGVNTFVLNVNGTEITTTANGTAGTFNMSDSVASSIPSIKNGTIGFNINSNTRTSLQYIKVTAKINEDLIKFVDDNAKDFTFISADMPILPMEEGTKLNLGNIYFEFDNGKLISGQKITWTTDSASGFYLNNNDKSFSMFKAPAEKEPYVITASAEGVEPKTFYAFVPDANNEFVIYDKTFSAEDLEVSKYDAVFTDESEWLYDPISPNEETYTSLLWNSSATGLMPYDVSVDVESATVEGSDSVKAVMFLRPESASGQFVSNFRNVAVDFTVNSIQTWTHSGSGFVGPIARFVLADDFYETEGWDWPEGTDEAARSTALSRVESFWRIEGTDGNVIKASKTAVTVGINGNTTKSTRSDGMSVDWVQQSFVFKGNKTVSVQRLKVVGNAVEAYVKASNEANFNKAEFTMTDAMSSAINNTTAGTIGFYWGTDSRVAVQSAKVSIVVTDDEKAFIKDNSEPINTVSVIPANKPALPATVDTMIKLSGFYVEFNNGVVVPASEITWETADASKAYVDDIGKTVTILKSGTSTIKASYAGEEKLIYLVTGGKNNQYTIYNHKFSNDDLEGTDLTEASEWATNVGYVGTAHGALGLDTVNHNATKEGAFWLRPDSASGKMISAFNDLSIEFTSKALGVETGFAGPFIKTNLGEDGVYNFADTGIYIGISARALTSGTKSWMRIYLSGSTRIDAGDGYTYPTIEGTTDELRYPLNCYTDVEQEKNVQFTHIATVKGNQLTLKYILNDSLNKEVISSNVMTFNTLNDSVANGGTIGFYGTSDIRNAHAVSYKVSIELSAELKQLVENNSQAVSLIQKDKPAIPMDIGQTLDLSILTLTDKNGNLIEGSKATWALSDESAYLVYDDISNTITSFSAGYATLTATDKGTGNTAVVYLTVANSKGEYVIYQHTFSAGDLVEKSGYNVFTEDSEWYAKNLTIEGGEDQLRLGYRMNQTGSTHIYQGLTTSYSGTDPNNDPTRAYNSLIYLRPESASGIKVSSFSDFTLDYSAGNWGNGDNFTGPLLRMQFDKDGNRTNYTNPHFYYRNAGSPTWLRLYDNGTRIFSWGESGATGILYGDGSNVEVVKGQRNWFSYAVNGNDLTIKVATDDNYSDAFTLQVNSAGNLSVTSADGSKTANTTTSAYSLNNISGGTIGFSYQLISPYGLYDIAVKLTFTDEEKAYLSRFVSDFEDITVKEYEDITQYREGSKFTAPTAPYNKVFAGWYMDEACTVALKSDEDYTGRAFAKFVNDDMFSVKWQITNPSDATRNGKVDLRLVTSIDSLRYNAMAFEIIRVKGDKRQKAVIETNEVFKNILGDDGFKAYDPTVFTDVSKYFATGRITNTDWTAWGDGTYYVTVMLETLDGTIVRVDNEMNRFKMNYDDQAIDIAEEALREQIYKLEDTVKNMAGTKYYVSSSEGNDSNLGTSEAAPLATLTKALAKANEGDEILLKRGDTFREHKYLTIDKDNVSIGAYGSGEKPVLLGSFDISGKTVASDVLTKDDDNKFTVQGVTTNEKQTGLNKAEFTAPEGTNLWTIDVNNTVGKNFTSDFGAIFFVEKGDNITVGDKKWNRDASHALYNVELDVMDAPYDFFYDYNNKQIYVLLPEGKTPADFEAIEVLNVENMVRVAANNVTIENIEFRYANFGVVVYGVDGTTLRGLEIGWIGGNRQSDLGNYNLQGYNGQYVRLGNGIENWGAGSNFTIDQCYVYECYDAGITFQNNTQKAAGTDREYYEKSVFQNIKFTNNLLTRNIYNIEYFQSHVNGKDDTYIKNILFEGNICRDPGGTAEDPMWASLYRPDKGVAANIKGSTTGNNTMLTDNPNAWLNDEEANYSLEAKEGYVSSFQIKNNIFDGSYDNSIMHFSAANKGGAPIFEGNLVVGEGTQTITVDRKSYSIKDFVKKFDAEQGGSVVKSQSTASAVFASQRTFNTWGAVKETNALNNTKYLLETKKAIKVGYLGGSVTDGTNANNWVEDDNYQADLDSWRALTTQWLHQEYPDASVAEIMASQGGTASYWAFHRLETDLLVYKPDLVFIDFAVNDNYSGLTATESALYMEGIVKKLRAANPNVDIVFVIVADNQNYIAETGSQDAQWVDAHYAVANHYGIPVIDVRDSIAKDNTVDLKNNWDTYFSDSVHPSKAGYAKYAEYVRTELETILANASADVYAENEMPEGDYVSNLATSSEFRRMDKVTIEDKDGKTVALSGTEGTRLGAKVEEVAMLHDGDVIKTSFTGKTLGFYLDSYADNLADGSKVTFSILIDGKTTVIAPQYKGGYNIEYIAIDNLAPGRHTVEITVVSTDEKPIAIGGLLIAK